MSTDHDRYRRALHRCSVNAERSLNAELRQFWTSIADSYAFLLQHGERFQAEADARTKASRSHD